MVLNRIHHVRGFVFYLINRVSRQSVDTSLCNGSVPRGSTQGRRQLTPCDHSDLQPEIQHRKPALAVRRERGRPARGCCCSVGQSCPTLQPHGLLHASPPCPSPSPGVCSNSSIESVMPSNHLILCRPRLLLPSIFPSIRDFSNESAPPIRWPKYWSFSIRPSNG